MNKIKSIHFVGIKGVGMTPLAIIAKEAGIQVTGSDIDEEFITDEALKKAQIVPQIGFSEKNVGEDVDLVITTGAHGGFNNLEVQIAKKMNIKVITQGEAVGVFMDGKVFDRKFEGISVTGTHGKTTTSAMVATILKANKKDPSFLIGTSEIKSLGAPGHFGKGKYFVAEADEYMTEPSFDKTIKHMWQHPKIAVITSIEFDHPDAYISIDDVRENFLKFANQLPEDGFLIACGDDPQIQKLISEFRGEKATYGFNENNDYVIDDVLKDINLSVFGDHNRLDAAAAYVVGLKINLSREEIKKGLEAFSGSKRRSEFLGILKTGAKVYDDYAHHPTKIEKTLKAFKEKFPKSKIVCIFQPHTYSRTKSLFEQFSKSFDNADKVILADVFASQREKYDPSVSMPELASRVGQKAVYISNLNSVLEYVNRQRYGKDVVLITMGAGDIYKINSELIK